jgi:pyruvate dehydrogenase E2 component (dihydrolipoamide acetyltransferase)
MATPVLMPKQGNSVDSCLIIEWKKNEGDQVQPEDILCEVETDKAVFEIEAEVGGTLLKTFFEAGDDVPVLTNIAAIGEPGEDVSSLIPDGAGASEPKEAVEDAAPVETPVETPAPAVVEAPVAISGGVSGISPRAKNLATAKAVDYSNFAGSGPGGRVIERDIKSALDGKAPISPAALAEMKKSGMQAPAAGSGIGGRVMKGDLTARTVSAPATVSCCDVADFPGALEEVPVKGVRKLIAERMLASLQNTAQLTLNASADASAILGFRKKLKNSSEALGLTKVTINDLILFAVSRVVTNYPELNSHFLGDKMLKFKNVHLGFAVDTPRGLMVPVIKYANRLSLKELANESKRLAMACIEGSIAPDDLDGGTFTISNLGQMGIESFTPVLNAPQAAILGVCNVQLKPVMKDGEVKFIPHMGLSLTFDHRAADGAPAAKFMKELSDVIADFEMILAC